MSTREPHRDKIQLDIWGVCTTRDILGITGSDRYIVNAYFQLSIPPAFINEGVQDKIPISKDAVSSVQNTNYWRKTLAAEYNGIVLKTFNESASDWIVVDLRSILKGNYVVTIEEKQYYYSFQSNIDDSVFRNNIINYWKNNGVIIDNAEIQKVDFIDVPGCDEIFDDFCSFLKKRYGKKIILVPLKQADYKVNGIGKATYIGHEDMDVRNLILDRYTCTFMDKVECYCIHVPANIVADDYHPWGSGDVHYVREFYDYGLKCLDIITSSYYDKLPCLDRVFLEYVMLFDQIRCGFSFTQYSTIHTFEKRIQTCSSKENFDVIVSDCEHLSHAKCNFGVISEIEGRLARAYRDGKGVEKNIDESIRWMRAAAEKNSAWAKNELFDILWNIGTQESYSEMIPIITESANTGDSGAMGRLGRAYRDGKGVGKDLDKAAEWMRKAVNKSVAWKKELDKMLASCFGEVQ